MSCPTDCLPGALPTLPPSLISEFGKPELNKWGISTVLVYTCDATLVNVNDVTEWQAHVTSGKLICLPIGIVVYNNPSQTNVTYNGCGDETVGLIEHTFDYTTYETRTDGSDYEYFCNLFRTCGVITAIPIDCDGQGFVNKEFADAVKSGGDYSEINPGLSFSFTSVPHKTKDGELGQWTLSLKHENASTLCPVDLTDVVEAVCIPCVQNP